MTKERKEETKDNILQEFDDKIYEMPDLPKLEIGDGLLSALGTEAKDILQENFVNSKELEEKTLEDIKEEHGFNKIKNAFDHASVTQHL